MEETNKTKIENEIKELEFPMYYEGYIYNEVKLTEPLTIKMGSKQVSKVFREMQEYAMEHPEEEVVGFTTQKIDEDYEEEQEEY